MGLVDLPFPPPGFEPLPEMVRVPLVGSIACGTPITAEQNIECYIGVPAVCPPMVFAGPQLEEIQIEGRAVGFCRGL